MAQSSLNNIKMARVCFLAFTAGLMLEVYGLPAEEAAGNQHAQGVDVGDSERSEV